jgi:hypothetical protein
MPFTSLLTSQRPALPKNSGWELWAELERKRGRRRKVFPENP